jgi:hypothetical protein
MIHKIGGGPPQRARRGKGCASHFATLALAAQG